jgi:hypothetical protein
MLIPDPDLDFLPIPDPGSKRLWTPDPEHCFLPIESFKNSFVAYFLGR